MAKVTYNELIFPFADILDFKNEIVYDDEGQPDYILSKYDITVMVVINTSYIKLFDPKGVLQGASTAGTLTTTNIMKNIRQYLSEPRRTFTIELNDVNLIPTAQQGNAGFVDAKNGPQPMSCNIMDLTSNTFMVTWRVVAHYWENLSRTAGLLTSNDKGAVVLFNRWSDRQDINADGYTERTREGVFAIRSDNFAGVIVDKLRQQMAVVAIPQGFTRKAASYHVQPDGLRMRYALVDKEEFKMPPIPAKRAEGTFSETIQKGEGVRDLRCSVILWGDKTNSQPILIQTAMAVVSDKIGIRIGQIPRPAGNKVIPDFAKIEYDLYQNKVTASMAASVSVDTGKLQGVNAFKGMNTTLPLSDGQVIQPSYPTAGTCNLLLEAAKYYDPSLNGVQVEPFGKNLTQGLQIGTAGTTAEPSHATPPGLVN